MAFTRKLFKLSTASLAIVLPKAMIKKYGWRSKQKLTITDKGGGMIAIRDWRRNKKR